MTDQQLKKKTEYYLSVSKGQGCSVSNSYLTEVLKVLTAETECCEHCDYREAFYDLVYDQTERENIRASRKETLWLILGTGTGIAIVRVLLDLLLQLMR